MFTGLIETVGEVLGLSLEGTAGRIRIRARFAEPLIVSESVAVDGACLTVTSASGDGFEADVSAETLSRTTLGSLRSGRRVNLERALKLGDRLGGHLVLGHVDGVGRIADRRDSGNGFELSCDAPRPLLRYVAEKGSVAVDGVSLTVSGLAENGFRVAVIPFTAGATTLAVKRPGDAVNLEVDVLSRYIERLRDPAASGEGVSLEFLGRAGYL